MPFLKQGLQSPSGSSSSFFLPLIFFLILVGGESTFNSLFSKQEVTVSSLKGFVRPELLPVAAIIWMLVVLKLISFSTSAKWQSVVQTPREFDIFNLLPCCDLDQERNKCLGLEKRVCSSEYLISLQNTVYISQHPH